MIENMLAEEERLLEQRKAFHVAAIKKIYFLPLYFNALHAD